MSIILSPTDFSENAVIANAYALELANLLDCELTLLHVFSIPFTSDVGVAIDLESIKLAHMKKLEELKEKISAFTETSATINNVIEFGFAQEAISTYAKENEPIAIVMGTKGASGLERMILGSISYGVIKHADYPTFLIPEGNNKTLPTHILYATNFEEIDNNAIGVVHSMAGLLNATIDFVHIGHVGDMAEEKQLRVLKASFEKLTPKLEAKFVIIEDSSIKHGIEQHCEIHEIDLIAFMESKKTLLDTILHPSLTKKLIFESHVPMMVLPRPKA